MLLPWAFCYLTLFVIIRSEPYCLSSSCFHSLAANNLNISCNLMANTIQYVTDMSLGITLHSPPFPPISSRTIWYWQTGVALICPNWIWISCIGNRYPITSTGRRKKTSETLLGNRNNLVIHEAHRGYYLPENASIRHFLDAPVKNWKE